jgi:adenylate kinase
MNDVVLQQIAHWLDSGSINLFGIQFSGKDTQGRRLVELFNAPPLIGGGDILRNSVIPEHIKEIMHAGFLPPVDDFVSIVVPYLKRQEFAGKPLILSAVGRLYGEERAIMRAIEEAGHPLRAVILLHLDESLVWKRWELLKQQDDRGNRTDDSAEGLKNRLDEFRNRTMPVIDFYRSKGLLIEVDGSLPPDEVTEAILAGLAERAAAA